ncbi:hypothetical protein ABB37_09417 [Leptomonas pyrrhocoris]|uniref:Uncharacterized protein n=1 Tax=Leptomonas pyrrhocoris TaxID=157538 RepID=A0A0M9FQV3_LEPPY|nr:hypothetical protein ABB37_09417 [Leptomonas pyrrhocoris]KPA74147.1 hypothetical protein ABB37_09417 [Leptomonas pyrrhocoris]|eukprot:XP_015652586.1 hypothetical protein ABB37_09417 [Leptomonas pyrrhocoris]
MLHFVTGVYNSLFSTPEYHVLIVGRECAGKSTLLEQLKFLYTPATQQREAEQLLEEKHRTAKTPSNGTLESSTSSLTAPRHTVPPGTPLRATSAYMAQKRIRPTVGLNYAVVQHRFSPPVTVVRRVKRSELRTKNVDSLPPLPADIFAEQRARQQALLANAPSDAVTRVVLRDLGGQTALRDLWEKYYAQTQALVYVVDSTLPFRSPAAPTSSSSPAAVLQPSGPPRDHFTKKELEDLYRPDRQLLAKLLQHPLLEGVPVLLLSNKTDETPHMPLERLQEAMCLADLAADRAFYVREHISDEAPTSSDAHSDTGNPSPAMNGATTATAESTAALSRHSTRVGLPQRRMGESGFGEIVLRIVEISAMDGTGVAGAMDWLVAQLLFHARNVSADA